jgi:stage V sporulation protein AD
MKVGRQSWKFNNEVYLQETTTAVGPMESEGPLSDYFDIKFDDYYMGQKSWEQAEIHLLRNAINGILGKSGLREKDISLAFGGDLNNQLVPTHYVFREFNIPLFGVYGACSTSMEALLLASVFVNSNHAERALIVTGSHNMTAERQFRNPTEYGGPKPETAQHTVTGAGAGIVSQQLSRIKVESATAGIVIDAAQKNPSDMGSAMAPAAAETIRQHFEDLQIDENYYDLIVTGDLAGCGSPILLEILKNYGYDISEKYKDCGNLIYDKKQPVFAGGSGPGCCAVVTFGYLKDLLYKKEISRVLVVATGALLNPLIVQQKESIPCIAHAVALSAAEYKEERP